MAESLRQNLKSDNDCTVVYCKTEDDKNELDKEVLKNSFRLMKSETNYPILKVTDK